MIEKILQKGTHINKTNASEKCDVCHHWYFLNKYFDYEPYFCNGFHDLMQKAMSFNDDASIKGNGYRFHFWYISTDDAINIMKNLNKKTGSL